MADPLARLQAALADRYAIERELGRGGMATVYLAHDVRHERKVAVKVLLPELSAIIGGERFLNEIRVTANLQHPHILGLYDSGEASGLLYYVMPYVDGESLRERLVRDKQLPIADAVRIATEVADALDYAHRKGVIHRDIKPENILLHDGRARVADFGIALAVQQAGGNRLTETGLSLGTPQYMSPEQATGERQLTARTDVYALGCVLYEMLVGEPPFTATTAQALVAKVVTEECELVTAYRKTVPPHVAAAVHTALEKLPADRFGTAAEFAQALVQPDRPPAAPAGAGGIRPGGRRWLADWRSWVALGVAAGGVAFGLILRGSTATRASPVRFSLTLPGAVLDPNLVIPLALSPDGSRIAYVGTVRDSARTTRLHLFARAFDRLDPLAVFGTDDARSPFFSPDGAWIGFWVGNSIRKVPVSGGAPITVTDSARVEVSARGRPLRAADWGQDGKIVFPLARGVLARVDATGGTPEVIYRDTASVVMLPTVLPDGRGVLFLRCAVGQCGERQEVVVVDPATRVAKVVMGPADISMATYVPTGHLLYLRSDDALLAVPFDVRRREVVGEAVPVLDGVQAYAVSRTGTLVAVRSSARVGRLVLVSRDGSERRLVEQGRDYLFPTVSPDGRRVAVEIHDATGGHIWVYNLASATLTRLTRVGHNSRPAWSPDGSRIGYASARDTASGIYWVLADGSGPEHRVGDAGTGAAYIPLSFSPDGRLLAYATRPPGRSHRNIFTVVAAADSAPRPVSVTAANEDRPVFSPDGRWLAYVSNESGRDEVYVRAFPDLGGRWAVSVDGGTEPVWARSGREIFYRRADGWLTAATLALGTEPRVVRRDRLFDARPYFTSLEFSYDVFPDANRFLFIRQEARTYEVLVVLNWFEELRQRSPRGAR